jgi:sugar phosphate isomerase/epimerase
MREERVKKILLFSDFAKKLGVKVLSAHIGFIPEDKNDPDYKGLVETAQKIAEHCRKNDQSFALETGQEPANALLRFIENVGRPNLGVNFDPANMLLYDTGNPIEALDILRKYVIGVHCKDGKRPERKGELGKEYPLGKGNVGIERLINELKKIGYTGPLTIEREIVGEKWIEDILMAKGLLEKLR